MAKFVFLLGLLFVGGFAFPASFEDDATSFDEEQDMSIFFDHSEEDFDAFIIGGNNAAEGAFPWMVALTQGTQRSLVCGASIINNRRFLTAAHCIIPVLSGGQLVASLRGNVGTNRFSSGGASHQIQGHRIHPNYNANTLKNDIGMLATSAAVVMTNRVRAVPISWENIGANVPVRVSGWGRTSAGGALAQNLQELRKNTVAGQHCVNEVIRVSRLMNARVPHVDPNLEICTFNAVNRGLCHGDSGSALIRNSNNQQIGLVSWGVPCARGAPDMHVRLSAFRNWITSNM